MAAYHWTKKQAYITCNTLNHSLNDMFCSIRAYHMAQSYTSELFSSDGHNLPIVFVNKGLTLSNLCGCFDLSSTDNVSCHDIHLLYWLLVKDYYCLTR